MSRYLIVGFLLMLIISTHLSASEEKDAEKIIVDTCLHSLNHDIPAVRERAAYELGSRSRISYAAIRPLLRVAESDEDDNVRVAALRTLSKTHRIFSEISDTLKIVIKDNNPDIRAAALLTADKLYVGKTLFKQEYIDSLGDESAEVRAIAASALGRLGRERPEEAIVPLTAALNDECEDVRFEAAYTLVRLGERPEAAVPIFIDALDDLRRRKNAIGGLHKLGPLAESAVPFLVEIITTQPEGKSILNIVCNTDLGKLRETLEEKKPDSALLADIREMNPDWFGMGKAARDGSRCIKFYWQNGRVEDYQLYRLENEYARGSATLALGIISSKPEVVELLIDALDDYDSDVRGNAAIALAYIGESAKGAIPIIIDMLNTEPDPWKYIDINHALLTFGPLAADAVPVYIEILKDEEHHAYYDAPRVLAAIGPAAVDAIPELLKLLDDFDGVQSNPARAKYEMITDAIIRLSEFIPERDGLLEQLFEHDNPYVCYTIIQYMEESGLVWGDVLKSYIDDLSAEELWVRDNAALKLTGMEADAVDAVPALIQALGTTELLLELPSDSKDGENIWRRWEFAEHCMQALRAIGPGAVDAVPVLRKMLGVRRGPIKMEAAFAIASIGPEAADAVPELTELLYVKHPDPRLAAAYALGQIGPGAADGVPALINSLTYYDPGVRWNTATALGLIGVDSYDVLYALHKAAVADSNSKVRQAALDALNQILGDTIEEQPTE